MVGTESSRGGCNAILMRSFTRRGRSRSRRVVYVEASLISLEMLGRSSSTLKEKSGAQNSCSKLGVDSLLLVVS